MRKKISPTEMCTKWNDALNCVATDDDEFIIEDNNKSLAVLISLRKYQAMMKFVRRFLIEFLDTKNNLSESEIEKLIKEAQKSTRKK